MFTQDEAGWLWQQFRDTVLEVSWQVVLASMLLGTATVLILNTRTGTDWLQVTGLGFGVPGLGSMVSDLGFRVPGLGSMVPDLDFGVFNLGFCAIGCANLRR